MSQITAQLINSIAEQMGLVHAKAKFATEYLQYYYEPNKEKVLTEDDIKAHTQSFQKMFGLTVSGIIDGQTFTAMSYPRCGRPDFMMISNEQQAVKWGTKRLSYYVEKYVGGISQPDQDAILDLAFRQWEEVADLDISRTTTKESANLVLSTGKGGGDNFDGASGTLAWAYLPPNSNYQGQLLMRFDLDETWVTNSSDRGILLLNVACHEFGHMLGLEHSQVQRALMAPYYAVGITKPQPSDDIPRIQALYGKNQSVPVPPPPPPTVPPAGGNRLEITGISSLDQIKINGKPVANFTLITP